MLGAADAIAGSEQAMRTRQTVLEARKAKLLQSFLGKALAGISPKACSLMAVNEKLTRIAKPNLRELGWTKAVELVKIARTDGEEFDSATWLHS